MDENSPLVELMNLVSDNARFTPASYTIPGQIPDKFLCPIMLFFPLESLGR